MLYLVKEWSFQFYLDGYRLNYAPKDWIEFTTKNGPESAVPQPEDLRVEHC